jgi:hypothetical protein
MRFPALRSAAEQRQRVVYGALCAAFGKQDPRVGTLFGLWRDDYAAAPRFALASYLDRAGALAKLDDGARRSLAQAFERLLFARLVALAPLPEELVAAHVPTANAARTIDVSAAAVIFGVLAQGLIQAMLAAMPEPALRKAMSQALLEADPGRPLSAWLDEVLRTRRNPLPPTATLTHYRIAMVALRRAAAASIGADASASALARAIAHAQALPQAQSLSPHALCDDQDTANTA